MLNQIQQVVLRLLARREYAALELKQLLSKRGYPLSLISQVLADFQSKGYQSDERFAGQCYRSCLSKGYGPLKIAYIFKQNGLSSAWLSVFESTESVDWCQRARDLLEKYKWRFQEGRNAHKPQRFLLARGFPNELIRQALQSTFL